MYEQVKYTNCEFHKRKDNIKYENKKYKIHNNRVFLVIYNTWERKLVNKNQCCVFNERMVWCVNLFQRAGQHIYSKLVGVSTFLT